MGYTYMSNQSYWSKINPTAISKFSKCKRCEGRGYYSSLKSQGQITNDDIDILKDVLDKLFINPNFKEFNTTEDAIIKKINKSDPPLGLRSDIIIKLKSFVCPTCHGSGGKFKNVLKLHKAIKNFGFLGNFKYMNPTDPNLVYIKDYITYEGWSGVMPIYEMKETIDRINYNELFYGLGDSLIYGKWDQLIIGELTYREEA